METKLKEYSIHNYIETDTTEIGMINQLMELSYRYNPDFACEDIDGNKL